VLACAALGLLASLAILTRRNFYEDEWVSLTTIHQPLAAVLRWSNTRDIHPPGVYALDWLLLPILGGPRRLAAVHLLVWSAGLLAFVLAARRLPATRWGRAGFALLAFFHPQVLMWNSSLRWYPVWWGIALTMVAVGILGRGRGSPPGWRTTLALAGAGAALIYCDYLALLFLPSFALAWLLRHGWSRASVPRLGGLALVTAVLAVPQLVLLTGEIVHAGRGQMTAPLLAGARLAHALSVGGAILPWHPVAVAVALGLLLPAALLALAGLPAIGARLARDDPPAARELVALLAIPVPLVAAAVATGIASHTYVLMGLAPFVALFLALGAERVRAPAWRAAATLLAVAWVATGAWHLAARTGTAKRQINDHPERIVARLEQLAGGGPALVVTNDLVLTFEIGRRRARGTTPLVVASCWEDRVHGNPPGLRADPASFPWVFVIGHPDSEYDEVGRRSHAALERARGLIASPRREDLGPDPDWRMKRRIPGARVESARLRAWYGRPLPGDWREIGRRLEDAARQSIVYNP
jgi:hypothetical protein